MTSGQGPRGRGEDRRFGKRRRQAIIGFGNPVDPNDETSVVLAGDMTATPAHNGTLDDIDGSWVELEIGPGQANGLDDPITCHHNLFTDSATAWAEEPVTGEPNVTWFVDRWEHDGARQSQWEDLRTPATAAHRGARTPTFAVWLAKATRGVWLDWFATAPGNEEEVFFNIQMPHSWHVGSDVYPHVHWTPDINAVGADQCVKWGLEFNWTNIGAVAALPEIIYTDATDDSTQTIQNEQLVANTHYVSEFTLPANGFPPLDGAGKTISSMFVCRLFRNTADASDDYLGSAGLMEFDLHYEVDGHGSDSEMSKTAGVELEWNPFNVRYQTQDPITANSIDLRFYAGPGLLVDASHPLKVTLFFQKAVK